MNKKLLLKVIFIVFLLIYFSGSRIVLNKCAYIYYYQDKEDGDAIITPYDSIRNIMGWFYLRFYIIDFILILFFLGSIYAAQKYNQSMQCFIAILIMVIFQIIIFIVSYPEIYILQNIMRY